MKIYKPDQAKIVSNANARWLSGSKPKRDVKKDHPWKRKIPKKDPTEMV